MSVVTVALEDHEGLAGPGVCHGEVLAIHVPEAEVTNLDEAVTKADPHGLIHRGIPGCQTSPHTPLRASPLMHGMWIIGAVGSIDNQGLQA